MSGYSELDKFYDKLKIAYIFGANDLTPSLTMDIFYF